MRFWTCVNVSIVNKELPASDENQVNNNEPPRDLQKTAQEALALLEIMEKDTAKETQNQEEKEKSKSSEYDEDEINVFSS